MTAKPDKTGKDIIIRRKRLKFQAWHRGTQEADLILGRFVDQHLERFDAEDLDWFDRLLKEPDQDILDWITGEKRPPSDFDTPIMTQLQTLKHMT